MIYGTLAALLLGAMPMMTSDQEPPDETVVGSVHETGLGVGGYGVASSSVKPAGREGSPRNGPVIERRQLLDCDGEQPDSRVPSPGCVAATLCPQNEVGPTTASGDAQVWLRMRQFQRQGGPTPGRWELAGTRCVPIGGRSDSEEPSLLELVVVQWRQVHIPAPTVQVQPPGGRTLVNLDTIVFTDGRQRTWPVQLLGHHVQIRAVPMRFQWRFGDGAETVTDQPGAPYPDQTVWHAFAQRGPSWASVDVTYRGEYHVDGNGDWLPIPGQVTRPGPRAGIDVVEQRTELIAGN